MAHAGKVLPAGLGVVVLWASAFPAIQDAAPRLGAIGLSIVRLVTATSVLLALAPRCRVRMPRRRDLGWVAACGFFGMAAYQLLLNHGELRIAAGTASIIIAAAPLVSIMVARALFAEAINRYTIVGGLVALGGVLLVCLHQAGVPLGSATVTMVGAMVVQGIYHPLQRPLLRRYRGLEVATYAMVAGTVMALPLVPWGWARMTAASPAAWLAAGYLGVLPSALGFVLWGYAVARLPVATSTSLLYLVPPVAVLIAWAWLGHLPTVAELIGGLIVIAGMGIISLGRRVSGCLCESRSAGRASATPPRPRCDSP